jgi:hypothetical protein
MPGKAKNIVSSPITHYRLVLDSSDSFTCSFKEFLPFNAGMYYYSSFKAFEHIISA